MGDGVGIGIIATLIFIGCIIGAFKIGRESGMGQCINHPTDSECIEYKVK